MAATSPNLRRLALALPVALAFADASIVLLALPQVVARLHTSISHVVWVLVVYNLALIAGSLVVRSTPAHPPVAPLLISGLALFGAASLAAGLMSTLTGLLIARGFQGAGGAVLLCASLPPLARATRQTDLSALRTWSAAAAIGAAVGPAAGGVLTQLFDWRAIFIAQAPVAALAAIVVWRIAKTEPSQFADPVPADQRTENTSMAGSTAGAVQANLALMLLSAGLIGTLFLSTLLLIDVWTLKPIVAAAVLLMLPVVTALSGRLARGVDPKAAAVGGSVAVAAGIAVLAIANNRAVGLCLVALALSGAGLGVAFAALTEEALSSGQTMLGRVANTIAARDLGLVVGLLALTPIFVHDLGSVQSQAQARLTPIVEAAQISTPAKLALAVALLHAANAAPQSQLPDIGPAFALVQRIDPSVAALQPRVESIIRSVATGVFRDPLLGAAAFALLAMLVAMVPVPRRPDD